MTGNKEISADRQLAQEMAKYYADPLGFVMFAYPWDAEPALQMVKLPEPWRSKYNCEYGPDKWACEMLDEIGQAVRERRFDGHKAVKPIREAVTSGHGIGKSAATGWLVDWIMSTRPYAQGTVTANTGTQLETKTWAQIAKWTKHCITAHWFEINTGRGSMKMYHKNHKEEWFVSAHTCQKDNSEAFAGQHAANSTSFYIYDEASAVPNEIKEVSEGGMTDGEPMMFAFGNPTRNDGWFADSFSKHRDRWNTRKIDSRSVQITNKTQIQEWLDDYGVDSDFFKVRVRGEFPNQSATQFISKALIEEAAARKLDNSAYRFAPIVISSDCAGDGDDKSTLLVRQGLHVHELRKYPQIEAPAFAAELARAQDEYKAFVIFADVVGVGWGVVSILRAAGRNVIPVNAGSGAGNNEKYFNKRAEMWGLTKDWLAEGGSIPDDQELKDELASPEYFYTTKMQIQIESKKDMKARGLPSPDCANALNHSFAMPMEVIEQESGYDYNYAANREFGQPDPDTGY